VHQRDEFWLGGNAWSRAPINHAFKLSHAWLKKMNSSCNEREIVHVGV
jgi:hypothetical protein